MASDHITILLKIRSREHVFCDEIPYLIFKIQNCIIFMTYHSTGGSRHNILWIPDTGIHKNLPEKWIFDFWISTNFLNSAIIVA